MPSRTQAPTQLPRSGAQQDGPRRTLWEQGQHPGRLVIRAAVVALLAVTIGSLLLQNRIGIAFDVVFVLICVGAALWVHPHDFFAVGVLPPLLLSFAVVVLALVDRAAVARADDPLVQAVVSGLAHHSMALVIGYASTLLVLALRQVALRHRGTLRLR